MKASRFKRVTCLFSFAISTALALSASAQSIGTQHLRGHAPKEVARVKPVGTVPSETNLQLAISLPLRNTAALSNLLNEIYRPGSPSYHHYITPRQFTAQFGPTARDYLAVIKFARNNGLRVTTQYPNRMVLDVSGSVADIQRAFHTTLHTYQHPKENRLFYAPDTEPSVDLDVPILDIDGLDNYSLPRPRLKIRPSTLDSRASPQLGAGPGGSYMGNDFRGAYVPDTTLTGSGQVVGLLQFDGYTPSDITYYENQAGLPNVPLQNVLIDGATGNPSGSGGEVEVSLDIEMAISMAPGLSKIIVYEGTSSFVDIFNRMASDNRAKQLSCSWFIPGGTAEPAADQIFQEMAAQGQSFFNASGDGDAYTGLIDFPGDTPYVTQVGGTTLTASGPGGSWVSETVWNWGNEFGSQYDGVGSGGGISTQYSIPTYQTNISMTANQGSTTMRNTPDVALTADNVYVRADGIDRIVGGTSCAAPLWAGFSALVNQEAVASGHSTIGFVNPLVDAIGTGQNYGTAFHDITTGNNEWSSSPNKFSAVAGYDLCTGWGAPAGQHLIDALANPEALVITPASGFTAIGGVGGPFSVASENFSLINSGTNMLTWTLVNTSSWLNASISGGTLSPGGPATIVTFNLNNTASGLPVGNYTATVWFTNLNDNVGQSRQFELNVISPPSITREPTNEAVLDGTTATFGAGVAGGLPLFYQWQFNGTNLTDGGNITGSMTTTLTISNASTNNVGAYDLVATNYAGVAVSSNALLSLIPSAPIIILQPTNETVGVNQTAVFSVAAVGTKPFAYQWTFNTTNLPGATNARLVLASVQFSQAGEYAVTVSNIYGAVTSSNALLTVLPCDPDPAGLVAWWRAEGDANDAIGTNDGILLGGLGFTNGEVGQAFNFTNNTQGVKVNESPSLAVQSITIEGWINPIDVSNLRPIVEYGADTGLAMVQFLYGWNDPAGTTPGALYGLFRDPSGGPGLVVNGPAGLLPTNQWSHVALTFDYATQTGKLYLDGTNVATSVFSGTLNLQTALPVHLGYRPDTSGEGYAGARHLGGLDEMSIYNRALSANEIAAIYNIGSVGKCFTPSPPSITAEPTNQTAFVGTTAIFSVTAAGTSPMYYQWNFNGTNIPGATNATLILNDVQFSEAGAYAVLVTNLYGSTNSTTATLTVNPPPPCDPTPYGIVAWWAAEGNANDSVGTNNGTSVGALSYTNGMVGKAFVFDGSSSYIPLASSPILQVGTDPGLTVECWIMPADGTLAPIVEWDSDSSDGLQLWVQNGTQLYANLKDTSGVDHQLMSTNGLLNNTTFQHVALTYDRASGNAILYLNGAAVVSTNLGSFIPETSYPNYNLNIGRRTGQPVGLGDTYAGLLDELSIYARALSQSEIQAIYDASVSGKCPAAPMIITEPINQTNVVGTTASFTVTATGTQPLSYQWTFNATNISGATNTTLVLTNVQFSEAGNYAIVITNLYGSTNSTIATLTVNPPPPCDPDPPGLVAWWRAEGDATDSIGNNNGTLLGGLGFTNGEVGQAFNFVNDTQGVEVNASPSLAVQSITIEGWINPIDVSNLRPIVEYGADTGLEMVQFVYGWNDPAGTTPGALYALFRDTNGPGLVVNGPAGLLPVNQWSHVAVTFDYTTQTGNLYLDGTNVATSVYSGTMNLQTALPVHLGYRPDTSGEGYAGARHLGGLDEMSIYDRALSQSEILAIYNAGLAGKCFTPVPPSIVTQPTNETVIVGASASFSVAASGTPTLTYQWHNGSGIIAGGTNSVLILNNVQLSDAGAYYVTVSNPYGSTNSASATLTVNPAPPCTPAPSGMISWWKAEGNANDGFGTNNGSPSGALSYTSGEVGQAFLFDGSTSYIPLASSPSLQVGTNSGLTIECWIIPAAGTLAPIVEWDSSSSDGLQLWIQNGTQLVANLKDTSGNAHQLISTNGLLNNSTFQHVALTYDHASGNAALYLNGTPVVSANFGNINPQTSYPAYHLNIGRRTGQPVGLNDTYGGLMDELSIYGRALSQSEIQAIYNAGNAGKCPVPPSIITQPASQTVFAGTNVTFSVAVIGSEPLLYQWWNGSGSILGATNSTLALSNVQPSASGIYYAVVTNSAGSVTSSNAVLTVIPHYYFVWNPIPSPRFVNTPFSVTIQAMLTNGVYTNFSGTVALTSTNGLPVNPTVSGSFNQGVWNGSIVISQLTSNLVLQATNGIGGPGVANPINIVALPSLATGVSGNSFYMTWPINPSGFVLETASDLNGPWVPVGGSPVQVGGEYFEQVQISSTNTFYRLRFTGP